MPLEYGGTEAASPLAGGDLPLFEVDHRTRVEQVVYGPVLVDECVGHARQFLALRIATLEELGVARPLAGLAYDIARTDSNGRARGTGRQARAPADGVRACHVGRVDPLAQEVKRCPIWAVAVGRRRRGHRRQAADEARLTRFPHQEGTHRAPQQIGGQRFLHLACHYRQIRTVP